MANVTVIGAQWGDEGKGKIVDWLAERADLVVRFQGGHNAGHTLVVGDQTYKLSLLPSGVVLGTPSVIGNGVVLDPWHLVDEVARLGEQEVRVTPDTLHISDACPLILPLHRELDGLREDASGAGKIGTTRRGIGPAYEDKVGRRAIRLADLAHLDGLEPQLDRLTAHHDALTRRLRGARRSTGPRCWRSWRRSRRRVLPFAGPVWTTLNEARAAGRRMLFEGAQGVLLDVDHGTYPFVTSSNTVAGTAAAGTGLAPGASGTVLGIAKALRHPRRRGAVPDRAGRHATGERLGQRGHEFGTVTGRKRRCGWFDAALVRQSVAGRRHWRYRVHQAGRAGRLRDNSKVGVGYELDGRRLDHLPTHAADHGPRDAGVGGDGGLGGLDGGRALLGRPARPPPSNTSAGWRN